MVEEAFLQIQLTGMSELNEPPFDWRPNWLDRLQGDSGKNWTRIGHFVFALLSQQPKQGDLIVYLSPSFRAFHARHDEVKFPVLLKNKFLASPDAPAWVERFFLERRSAWEKFNSYLAKNGWMGITQPALDCIPPFAMEMDRDWFNSKDIFHRWDALEQPNFLIVGSRTEKSELSSALEEIGSRYRYQKQD